ncbi:hypothetical protein GCM10027578_32160 [Spirosoma luteolum]
MWARKNSPAGCDGRPLPWVEDAVTGEIIAFVFSRRTNHTFRHFLHLLEEAKIEVIRWITDSWCGAARAGLL